jgi:hypothetical protein
VHRHRLRDIRRTHTRPAFHSELRQPEVQNLDLLTRRNEQIGGLDIPVDDALAVRRLQSIRRLHRPVDQQGQAWPRTFEPRLQRLAFQVLHREKRLVSLILADVVNRADVRMIDRGGRPGFAPESVQRTRVGSNVVGQKFQRYKPAKTRVLGTVNHTHASATDFLDDAVMRYGLAGHALGSRVRR